MIPQPHTSDTLANRLDNSSTFVSEDNWEGALRIFAGERVCVCKYIVSVLSEACNVRGGGVITGVTNSGVVDFDSDLMYPGRRDLDFLDRKRLSGLPCDSSFAGNSL